MDDWLPYANGFEGVAHEREGRAYILWKGCVNGEDKTIRLRVNRDTKERLIEELQDKG